MPTNTPFSGSSGPGGIGTQAPQVRQQVLAGAQHATIGSLSIVNQGGNYTSITNNYRAPALDAGEPHPRFSRDDIAAWLRAPNFRPIQQTAVAQRMLDTGTWFTESTEFQELLSRDGFQLWGTGMPGSGKTVLSAIAVEYLEKAYNGQADIGVSFAFLRYNERYATRDIIAGLLSQLVKANDVAYTFANVTYARARRTGAEPMEGDLILSLAETCRALKKLFVILDGLDEAVDDVKDQLLQVLPPTGVNLLITSRPLPLFMHHIPDATHVSIQARTEDIAVFVLEKIRRSSRLREVLRGRPELAARLSARIKESSQGMFLVARLQMEVIATKAINVNSIFRALDQLPSGVNQMYDHTLDRIKAQSPEDLATAWRVFIWLLHAHEPLNVRQMQIALCISVERGTFDSDDEIPVSTILGICGGLIAVERHGAVERFRFIHYTTREYTAKLSVPGIWDPHTILSVSCTIYLDEHEIYESISGVARSNIRDIKKAILFGDLNTKYYLWYYALHNWARHAGASQTPGPPHPYLMVFLLKHDWHYWKWPDGNLDREGTGFHFALRFRIPQLIKAKVFPYNLEQGGIAALNDAARFGDWELIEVLLSSYVVDGTGHGDGETFLHVAVRHAQTKLLETLLSEHIRPAEGSQRAIWDANIAKHINAQNHAGETALMVACQLEKGRHVELLASHRDCDPNLRDSQGKTALFYACRSRGHDPPLPAILIQASPKIDMGARCREGATAFMEACDYVQKQSIRWLLTQNSNHITQVDNMGRTPLMRLFRHGLKKDLVEVAETPFCAAFDLLLDYGSDLQAHDGEGMSAFLHAVASLDDNSEEWLTNHCLARMCATDPTVINQCNSKGCTVLMLAASGRRTGGLFSRLIRFILAQPMLHPESLYSRDNSGLTAFTYAFTGAQSVHTTLHDLAEAGDTAVPRFLRLLPTSWDAIPRTTDGDTLLHFFVRHGRNEPAKELLSVCESLAMPQGGDASYINAQNLAGETPLILACLQQNVELVQAIISCRGCNPNLVNLHGETALFNACRSKTQVTLPHLLIQALPTIDVNAHNPFGVTAFMEACNSGQEHTVLWFLEHDPAKVHEVDKDGRTALMRLFEFEPKPSLKVVEILLEHGSDLQVRDRDGKTPFLHALVNLRDMVVPFLEEICEADPTVVNQCTASGVTALMIALDRPHAFVDEQSGDESDIVPFLLSQPHLHFHLLRVRRPDYGVIATSQALLVAPSWRARSWSNIARRQAWFDLLRCKVRTLFTMSEVRRKQRLERDRQRHTDLDSDSDWDDYIVQCRIISMSWEDMNESVTHL